MIARKALAAASGEPQPRRTPADPWPEAGTLDTNRPLADTLAGARALVA